MGRAKVSYNALLDYTATILEKFGYSSEQAVMTAKVLVEADARGVASHGVARLLFYESNIRDHYTFPAAPIEVIRETPLSLVVDGHNGVGSCIADFTMNRVVEKALTAGAGFGAVRNSNHFGMAGLWAEMAAARGCIGMAFCNTRTCAIPTFGRERILGTNPVCFAIPTAGKTPFLLDMATTTVAHGKVEVCERRDKPLPIGWVVDETGTDTTDTRKFQKLFRSDASTGGHLFLGGAGEELGGHKGYGLGLFVDLLCAGLSMGSWSRETFNKDGGGISQFFGAIRLDLFGRRTEVESHIESILNQVRQSSKAAGQDRIYIHGEKEAEKREESLANGIGLDTATWKMFENYAARLGLDPLEARDVTDSRARLVHSK
jgi:L-2-hydroxycarboxylate dehydrogenase (NAD+)